jgi:hypothetical protein
MQDIRGLFPTADIKHLFIKTDITNDEVVPIKILHVNEGFFSPAQFRISIYFCNKVSEKSYHWSFNHHSGHDIHIPKNQHFEHHVSLLVENLLILVSWRLRKHSGESRIKRRMRRLQSRLGRKANRS